MGSKNVNEMVYFAIMAFFVVGFCFFIVMGCNTTAVTYDDIMECFITCEERDGLDELERKADKRGCRCGDGSLHWEDAGVSIYKD